MAAPQRLGKLMRYFARPNGMPMVRAQFSTHPKSVIIGACGPERIGIIHDLSGVVAASDGSIAGSKMIQMGNDFGVLMQVDFPEEVDVSTLTDELTAVKDLSVSVIPASGGDLPTEPAFSASFKLSGADNSGIVHAAAGMLRKHGLSITDMASYQESAPFGGTVIFCLDGHVAGDFVPDIEALKRDCADLEQELVCDLTMKFQI